jgi:ferredoxin
MTVRPNKDGPAASARYIVTDADLRSWLDALISGGWDVVAPVAVRGPRRFERIGAGSEADLESGGRVRWSAKEFLFPRRETLLSYAEDDGAMQLEATPLDEQPRVLFGLAPCDAAGLERLAAVFQTGPGDPYFQARRDATATVAFTCIEAGPDCFCTAVGGSPSGEEGSDVHVMLVEKGRYLLRALTDKGQRLIDARNGAAWTPATDEHEDRARQHLRVVEASIDRQRIPSRTSALLAESFNDSAWAEEAGPCLGCKVCTTVCPSCSCFDVYDEGSSACGERCRCWDGCTQKLFTAHATGHNPRTTQIARFRQRVMHKFSYFPDENAGLSMCVGCGRCAALCPAGLDIHQAVMRITERMQGRAATEGVAHGA